jgi:nitrilase
MEEMTTFKAAVIQSAPVLFDRQASVEKACRLAQEAASQGARLVLLPESFIPAYPRGFSFGAVVGSRSKQGRALWQRYWENSVDVPGPDTEILGEAARQANIFLGIGVTERDKGSLYCTLLYFGPNGRLLGKHRKIKPTASERLIWGEDDGSTLTALQTELGCIGGLICWENYMPLARMAMYQKGVQIYLAPTADSRDAWQATMRHIALEGRCYVLGCNQYVTREMYPSDLPGYEELANQPEVMSRGGSVIISPMGEELAGPLFDKEGILVADLDMNEIVRSKFDFDVVGHYSRPDIFNFKINER